MNNGLEDIDIRNNIIMRLDEQDLDNAMQNIQQARRDPEMRRLLRDTNVRGLITIPNWTDSRYVVTNQNSADYCTSLQIMLPGYEDVTPIKASSLIPFVWNNDGTISIYEDLILNGKDAIYKRPGETINIPKNKIVLVAEKPSEIDGKKSGWQKVKAFASSANDFMFDFNKDVCIYMIDHPKVPVDLANIAICIASENIIGAIVNTGKLAYHIYEGEKGVSQVPVASPEKANLIPHYLNKNDDDMRDEIVEYYTFDENDPTFVYLSTKVVDFSDIFNWNN